MSIRKRFVKNNMVSVAKITQKKEPILLDSFKVIARLTSEIIDNHPSITGNTFFSIKSTLSKILGLNVPVIPTYIFFSILT